MEATKKAPTPGAGQVSAKWGEGSALDQVFVDELLVTLVKDRAYVTFGQLKMPVSADMTKVVAEIVPMARVIITRDSLQRMLTVLTRLIDENPPERDR